MKLVLKLLSVAIPLGACTSSPESKVVDSLRSEEPSIDRLVFDTACVVGPSEPDVNVTVTGDAARAIYDATLALPATAPGVSCPESTAEYYNMSFYAGDALVVPGTIHPSGCQMATLAGTVGIVSLVADDDYWTMLAQNLGIAESLIYPARY